MGGDFGMISGTIVSFPIITASDSMKNRIINEMKKIIHAMNDLGIISDQITILIYVFFNDMYLFMI